MISLFSSYIKFAFVLLLFVVSTPAHAELIQKFAADYTISDTGVVTVVETIVYDFTGEERRGIFRVVKNKHPQSPSAWYKNRFIDIDVQSVKRGGEPEPYTVDTRGSEVEIKIGEEDDFVQGLQTYVITYTLSGALSSGASGAEFYYNATGNDWEVPITLAVATVRGDAVSGEYRCYQGERGATDTCTNSMLDNSAVIFTANDLKPGSGLTIATQLDPAKVAIDIIEQTTWLLFGYVLAALWGLALVIYAYRFRSENYTRQTIVAQYEPYKNYLPMYTGYMFDNMLDPRDITAGILYLAEQGFIKITRTDKKVLLIFPTTDYTITLTKPLADIPSNFLVKVMELMFTADAAVGTLVPLSTLAQQRAKNAERIMYLKRDLEADLKANGYLESTFSLVTKRAPLVLSIMLVVFGGFVLVANGLVLVIIVLFGTLATLGILAIPRKTAAWFEAKNHTAGFKLFLSVTDKERFDFHNAPEKNPELFMQYLPYAVALGVEEKWAKVFEGITIPQPDWYNGNGAGAFSAAALTSDIGSFSTALSTDSGVSGSSGGGSSGGGGGGGGGGSW